MKNSLSGAQQQFELAEERKGKADDRAIKSIHSEEHKEKRTKKKKRSFTKL